MTEIRDRTTLITGAASGIGRLMALEVAARGGRLVLWDVAGDRVTAVAQEIADRGGVASAYPCDLTDLEAVYATAERVLAERGAVDVLVNNAGIVTGATLLEASDQAIVRTFQVNALAHFWTVRAFLPGMLERDAGHLVTVSSAGGLVGTARLVDYCASKFAAVGFDEALRLELRRLGSAVRTTVVCPFYIDTGMFAGAKTRFPWILPILKPEKVARRVVRAVERDQARVIMPSFVRAVFPSRLLPVTVFDALMGFFGINQSMDDFVGRSGPE